MIPPKKRFMLTSLPKKPILRKSFALIAAKFPNRTTLSFAMHFTHTRSVLTIEAELLSSHNTYIREVSYMAVYKDRTGEVIINSEEDAKKKGLRKMEIVAYRNSDDMDVLINDEYLKKGVQYARFIKREIKNPYHRSVYGAGCIGEGKYKASDRGIHAPHYNTWRAIMRYCSEAYQEKHPHYKGCTASDEWYNYQTFAAWYDLNCYEIRVETISINKDILIKGNKLYSEDTCILVPRKINGLLGYKGRIGKELPKGVSLQHSGKFLVQLGNKYISTLSTKEKAFHAFKNAKEDQIKEAIDLYQGKIPEPHYTKIRKALFAYEVCIDD